MKKLKSMYSSLSNNEVRGFWSCVVMAVLALIAILASTVPSIGNEPTLGNIIGKIVPVMIFLSAAGAALLILNRRFGLAGFVFIAGYGLSFLLTPIIVEGIGFITAAIVFISCSYLAGLILKGRVMSMAQYISAVLAVIILLLEIYWPGARPEILGRDYRVTLYTGLAVVGMYAFFLVRQFPRFMLRSKLTIFALALGIFPMVMIGWMAAQVSENALTADADDALTSSATQLAGSLDNFVVFNLDSLRTEAKLKQVVEYLEISAAQRKGSEEEAELTELLNAFQQKSSLLINSYVLMDRFGIVVADTSAKDLYRDKSARIYFRETVRTGLPYVSPVIYPDLGSKASIFFAAPVRNAAGDIIGVLAAQYNADVLQQQILRQSSTAGHMGSFFILTGENNTLLAHTGNPDLMYKSSAALTPERYRELQNAGYMPADRSLEEMVFNIPDIDMSIAQSAAGTPTFSGEFFNFELEEGGDEERGAVVALTAAPWHIFSIQEADMLYAPINNLVRGIVLMGVVAGIFSVVMGVLLARFLTNPINRLVTVAEKVAEGDFTVRATVSYNDEVGMLAETFNTMASQLSNLIGSLEQRVADRTKALVTSTEVSRRLSTILDRQSLVNEVVEQLQKAFNYYHVHIYLFDESGEHLRLAGGTGDAAQTMLSRGHMIPRGRGLVGQAADTGMPVLVSDVSQSPGWLPNPLLPATKAELAVPIAQGEDVIGVLDVQQNTVGGLQQGDADLILSIASQVAVALQNARSYEETQRRANRESMMAAISQRIQRTATAEEALQVAVRELSRALDVHHATARLTMKPGSDNGNGNGHNHP